MSYTEETTTILTLFTEKEKALLEKWIADKGYSFWKNVVCGDCCGMYEDTYCIGGIFGKISTKERRELKEFIKGKNISAKVTDNEITAI